MKEFAMRWLARARRGVARHPRVRWVVVGMVALLVTTTVAQRVNDLDHRRRSWGDTTPVLVAVRDLAPGQAVSLDDVITDERPRAVVPSSALEDSSVLGSGARIWQWVAAGEVLLHHDVVGVKSASSRLPPGTRGVIVPSGGLPVTVGDLVDVVVDGDQLATATVIEVMSGAVESWASRATSPPLLVALARWAASRTAAAAAEGRVTVTLAGRDDERQPVVTISASRPPAPPG
jgi:pilus assembly protein CpaB